MPKTAKKTRKQEYQDKHSPAILNPTGLDEIDLLKGIGHKTIVLGNPPESRKCTSPQWKIIKFLYFDSPREEIPNWYACSKCSWLQNAQLGGGTGNLLHHAKSHVIQNYTFTSEQLQEAFTKCCEFVKSTGKMPDLTNMPLAKEW